MGGTATVEFTSARLRVCVASARQPAALGSIFDTDSGGKFGVRASIATEWPIFPFIATHLQLHLGTSRNRVVGKRVGLAVLGGKNARNSQFQGIMPCPPPTRLTCQRPSTGWPGPTSPPSRPSRLR